MKENVSRKQGGLNMTDYLSVILTAIATGFGSACGITLYNWFKEKQAKRLHHLTKPIKETFKQAYESGANARYKNQEDNYIKTNI